MATSPPATTHTPPVSCSTLTAAAVRLFFLSLCCLSLSPAWSVQPHFSAESTQRETSLCKLFSSLTHLPLFSLLSILSSPFLLYFLPPSFPPSLSAPMSPPFPFFPLFSSSLSPSLPLSQLHGVVTHLMSCRLSHGHFPSLSPSLPAAWCCH